MARREEEVIDIVAVRMLKEDCEKGLKKIDNGIKWSGFSFLSLVVAALFIALGNGIGGAIGTILSAFCLAGFAGYFVCMVMAIATGGGLGRVMSMMSKIAKWALYLVPFYIIDIIVAIYILAVGFALYITFPIGFFFLIKRTLKKDLRVANDYIKFYEEEKSKGNV